VSATEGGIRVCAPIHDALLIEAPSDRINAVVTDTRTALAEASRITLDGFELRTDTETVRHPNRYMDPRGKRMWETVLDILGDVGKYNTHLSENPTGTCRTFQHPYNLLSCIESF